MSTPFDTVRGYVTDIGLEITREDAAEQLLVVAAPDRGIDHLVLDCEGDILILEQLICELPSAPAETYAQLLKLNRNLIHGAFCLDEETGKRLIFRDTLALENLDCNEVESSVNALSLMLAENSEQLISFARQGK